MLSRRDQGEVWRREAYRRALEKVGVCPQSVLILMEKDDWWLRQGVVVKAAKRRRRT